MSDTQMKVVAVMLFMALVTFLVFGTIAITLILIHL